MLIYDMMIFGWNRSDIDNRLRKLIGPRQPGFWGWVEDTRVKFKKFQCRDLPAADSKVLQQRLDEAILSLGAEQAEATVLTLGNIKSRFSNQLTKANLKMARHKSNVRHLKSLHEAKPVDANSWIVKILEGVIFLFNIVSLPMTVPIALVRGGATAVQNQIRPPKASAAECAELRNQLMHQVFTLAKTAKKDAEELRKGEQFMAEAKNRYLAVQAPPDVIVDKKKNKKSRFGGGVVGVVTGTSLDGGGGLVNPAATLIDVGCRVTGTSLDGAFEVTSTSLHADPFGKGITQEIAGDARQQTRHEIAGDTRHEITRDTTHQIHGLKAGVPVIADGGVSGAGMYNPGSGAGVQVLAVKTSADVPTTARPRKPAASASQVRVTDEYQVMDEYCLQDSTSNLKSVVGDWEDSLSVKDVEWMDTKDFESIDTKSQIDNMGHSFLGPLPGTMPSFQRRPRALDNLMCIDYTADNLMCIDYTAVGGRHLSHFRDQLIPIPGKISPSGSGSPKNAAGALKSGALNYTSCGTWSRASLHVGGANVDGNSRSNQSDGHSGAEGKGLCTPSGHFLLSSSHPQPLSSTLQPNEEVG